MLQLTELSRYQRDCQHLLVSTSGKSVRAVHDQTNSVKYNTLSSIQESDCASSGQVRNFEDVFLRRQDVILFLYYLICEDLVPVNKSRLCYLV